MKLKKWHQNSWHWQKSAQSSEIFVISRGICRGVGVSSRKGNHFPFWTKMVRIKIKPALKSIVIYHVKLWVHMTTISTNWWQHRSCRLGGDLPPLEEELLRGEPKGFSGMTWGMLLLYVAVTYQTQWLKWLHQNHIIETFPRHKCFNVLLAVAGK